MSNVIHISSNGNNTYVNLNYVAQVTIQDNLNARIILVDGTILYVSKEEAYRALTCMENSKDK